MIRCGMSEVDITPPLGLPIPGYFRPRTATGVLDELCAKAMVVDDGNRKIAFVVVDAIALERAEVERIRRRVEQWTGIAPHHVMVSATHTHTGGPVYRQPPYDHEEYLSMVAQKAADAIVLADQRLRPAQIGFGREKVKGVSFNRRYFMKDGTLMTNPGVLNPDIVGPEGPVDDELAVIRVDDAQGNPIGAVINFALHLDTVGGNLYSADYPGHISRVLKRQLGERAVCLFMLGACGNVNHIDVSRPLRKSPQLIGETIARAALHAHRRIGTTDRLRVDARQTFFRSPLRQPTDEQLAWARRIEEAAQAGEAVSDRDCFFARHMLHLDRSQTETEIEVQTIKIGEIAVVGLPCELFAEFGLDLKRRSPFNNTIVQTLAGGIHGYVCTRESFARGGYESRLTSRTRLYPDAGYEMVESALELLGEMRTDI